MAKLWLPFYDLGAPISPTSTGLDVDLFRYLAGKAFRSFQSKLPRDLFGKTPETSPLNASWIAFWYKCFGLPPQPQINPHAGGISLIQALNRHLWQHAPKEFIDPIFGGSLNIQSLAGHLALQNGACRSEWLGGQSHGTGAAARTPVLRPCPSVWRWPSQFKYRHFDGYTPFSGDQSRTAGTIPHSSGPLSSEPGCRARSCFGLRAGRPEQWMDVFRHRNNS